MSPCFPQEKTCPGGARLWPHIRIGTAVFSGSQILPSCCDASGKTEAATIGRCWHDGTCGVGWDGGCRWEAAKGGGIGGQFLVTAVRPGAGVAGQALSPQSLPVACGSASPKNHQGQLNPSLGMEVTGAVRSHAGPQASLNRGGWMGCRKGWGPLCSLLSAYGMPCAPVPASPLSPCASIIVPIPLWCTLLHTPF